MPTLTPRASSAVSCQSKEQSQNSLLALMTSAGCRVYPVPSAKKQPVPVTQAMVDAMNGAVPKAAYMGRDLLCVFDDEDAVRHMTVDQEKVRALDGLLLHVTAPGKDTLVAYQASRRGSTLYCTQEGGRICMSGKAAIYAESEIRID